MTNTSLPSMELTPGHENGDAFRWEDYPRYSQCTWRCAVLEGTTLLGYRAWVAQKVLEDTAQAGSQQSDSPPVPITRRYDADRSIALLDT